MTVAYRSVVGSAADNESGCVGASLRADGLVGSRCLVGSRVFALLSARVAAVSGLCVDLEERHCSHASSSLSISRLHNTIRFVVHTMYDESC